MNRVVGMLCQKPSANDLPCSLASGHYGPCQILDGPALSKATDNPWADPYGPNFVRFSKNEMEAHAEAARQSERERCAKIAESMSCAFGPISTEAIADKIRSGK